MFLTSKNEYKINIPPFLVFQAITYCLIGKHVYSWRMFTWELLAVHSDKSKAMQGV